MMARIVTAQAEHIEPVAAAMRQADRDEIWAAAHLTPRDALSDGLRASSYAWAGMVDDEIVCLFGVSPLSIAGGEGCPWMLGTDAVVRHQRRFLRYSRPCLDAMRRVYPTLVNYVDERNEAAKRWLAWLGFQFDEPAPYGVERRLFRRFEMNQEAGS